MVDEFCCAWTAAGGQFREMKEWGLLLLLSIRLASLWRRECYPGAAVCGLLDLRGGRRCCGWRWRPWVCGRWSCGRDGNNCWAGRLRWWLAESGEGRWRGCLGKGNAEGEMGAAERKGHACGGWGRTRRWGAAADFDFLSLRFFAKKERGG